MRVAFSADGQIIEEPLVRPTPKKFEEGMELFSVLLQETVAGRQIDKAAGGITGMMDLEKQTSIFSPHLPDWKDKPLRTSIEKVLGVPAFLENDTAMVGLGEALYGAGKDKEIVVYITVSTGLGGARIVKGKIDLKRFGFEPGHQLVDISSGKTLEEIVSGPALFSKYNKQPENIDDPDVWKDVAKNIAIGVYNSVLHWSPDVVVIGGGVVMNQQLLLIEDIEKQFRSINKVLPQIPEIKKAVLGNVGGLYGALARLQSDL